MAYPSSYDQMGRAEPERAGRGFADEGRRGYDRSGASRRAWSDDRGGEWGRSRSGGYPQQRQPGRAPRSGGRPRDDEQVVRRRGGLTVAVLVLGVVLVVCAGIGLLGLRAVSASYPATVSLPDQLFGGLAKVDSPDLQKGVDEVVAGLKSGSGVRDAVAGVYAKADDPDHLVMVFAATGLFLRPERELSAGMIEFNTDGFAFEDPVDVDPGRQGGHAKCATGTLQADETTTVDFLLCGWADYGSVGMAGFVGAKDIEVGGATIVAIRDAVESH